MKLLSTTLPIAALLTSSALATDWFPACGWNDCISAWNGTSCSSTSGWDCVCTSPSDLSSLNSCIASSCSNTTGQEAIYAAIAQMCANAGSPITTAPAEATFSATSGGSAWPTAWSSWGGPPWFSALSSALPGAPTDWPGKGPWGQPGAGFRGFGPGGAGPCSWGSGAGGPGGGWGGPGGSQGPWTAFSGTWTACSTTVATATSGASGVSTITTTINGQVVTGATLVQKGATTSASTTGSTTGSTNAAAAGFDRSVGAAGAAVVAVVGAVLAL